MSDWGRALDHLEADARALLGAAGEPLEVARLLEAGVGSLPVDAASLGPLPAELAPRAADVQRQFDAAVVALRVGRDAVSAARLAARPTGTTPSPRFVDRLV